MTEHYLSEYSQVSDRNKWHTIISLKVHNVHSYNWQIIISLSVYNVQTNEWQSIIFDSSQCQTETNDRALSLWKFTMFIETNDRALSLWKFTMFIETNDRALSLWKFTMFIEKMTEHYLSESSQCSDRNKWQSIISLRFHNVQTETNDRVYTTLTSFSTKYLTMCKIYTDVGGIK